MILEPVRYIVIVISNHYYLGLVFTLYSFKIVNIDLIEENQEVVRISKPYLQRKKVWLEGSE